MRRKRYNPYGDKDRGRIQEEWPEMKFSEKCRYIWSYHKIPIIVVIIAAVLAVYFGWDIKNNSIKEDFNVMVLDTEIGVEETESLEFDLSVVLGLDTEKKKCLIETNFTTNEEDMASAIQVTTYLESGRTDLVIVPEETFNTYAENGYLEILTEPEFDAVLDGIEEDRYFYAEEVMYRLDEYQIPMHPHEKTENSDIYGIYLTEGDFEGKVIGIMRNAPHEDLVVPGVEFFLNK
ncbi:MAG: hypothetical protein LIO56_02405 [Lachnospiraceae bacterium]|nr:hypothetical protein [Lachnospiraceae bacterium]